jgi:hypothetical protein
MPDPDHQHSPSGFHWPSVLQLGFSLIGVAALWSTAFSLVLIGVVQSFTPPAAPDKGIPLLLMATGSALIGLLLLPSAGYTLLRLIGRAPGHPRAPGWMRPVLVIFLLPVALGAGYWVARQDWLAWLALPPLHVLAIGIPVLWIVYLAIRGLPLGSPQRFWGLVGSGSALAPLLILLIETGALVGGIIAWTFWVSGRPDVIDELGTLVDQLEQVQLSGGSPEILVQSLAPALRDPLVIFSIFAFGALVVPLIEEALKPLGAWFLAGSGIRPAEGFTAGILCGAGYALSESLLLASSGGEEWAALVIARLGTGLIHSLTAGLMGWALALAWSERRYVRLGAAYLGAVLIHGLWNGLTLIIAFAILNELLEQPLIELHARSEILAGTALALLGGACLAALLWINARLRREQGEQDIV